VIPLDEARAFVLAACRPLRARPVRVDDALGCVVAEPVVAAEPVPPFRNTSRDGYALRSVDTAGATAAAPAQLRVVGTVMAGTAHDDDLKPGQSVRIMTGAPVPDGADAVVQLEDVETEDGGRTLVVPHPVRAGTAVRPTGGDVAVGDVVATTGTVLSPGHLGVLVNQGMTEVTVFPRPRVGVLSTGDEITSAPEPLLPGQIRDSNRHTLLALVRREGWEPVDLGVVGDDEVALVEVLTRAGTACDAVVTSGGVSVGDLDMVKVVLARCSAGTMRWMQVAIQPAKPFAFGTLSGTGTPVFGLPGNPVSAMVSFELFVRPAVRRLTGHQRVFRPTVPALADAEFSRRPDAKTHFVRALVRLDADGGWRVRPMAAQDSHQLWAMAESNALAILPDGDGARVGDRVGVLVLDPDRLVVDSETPFETLDDIGAPGWTSLERCPSPVGVAKLQVGR